MPLITPEVLQVRHQELHDELARAAHEPRALGEIAKRVQKIMWAHLEKEEAFVLPALGLLEEVARGRRPGDLAQAVEMAERMRNEMDDMLEEHRIIRGALTELVAAARVARRIDCVELAIKLLHHAQLEESVLYPAVSLLGEHLRLKFGAAAAPKRLAA